MDGMEPYSVNIVNLTDSRIILEMGFWVYLWGGVLHYIN